MRIVHLSDTHIGKRRYNLKSSPMDFLEAFEEAFEIALSFSPDVIIHSGDVFDHPYPMNFTKRTIVDRLLRYSRSAIILIVAGNHDYADMDGVSPLSFFSFMNGNIHVSEFRDVAPAKSITPIDIDGVRFYPIPFVRDRSLLREILNATMDSLEGGLNLAIMHQIIDGFTARRKNISMDINHEELREFSFIFVGHFHTPFLDRDNRFSYAGSTEALSFDEYEYTPEGTISPSTAKRIFVYDFFDDGSFRVEQIPLKRPRPFLFYRMEYPSVEELRSRLENIPISHEKAPILILRIRAESVKAMEEYVSVINRFRSKNYYEHIRADITPDEVIQEMDTSGVEELKREILGEYYDIVRDAEGFLESLEDSHRGYREKLIDLLEKGYEDKRNKAD